MSFNNYPKQILEKLDKKASPKCKPIYAEFVDKKVNNLDINSKLFTESCKKIHESEYAGIITRAKLKNCESISSIIRYSKRLLETNFTVPILPKNTLTYDDMDLGFTWDKDQKRHPSCTTLFKYYYLNKNYPTLKTVKLKDTCWGRYLDKEILNGLNGIVKRSNGNRTKRGYIPYKKKQKKEFIRWSKMNMEGTPTFSNLYNVISSDNYYKERVYTAPMYWKILAFEDFKLHYLDWIE